MSRMAEIVHAYAKFAKYDSTNPLTLIFYQTNCPIGGDRFQQSFFYIVNIFVRAHNRGTVFSLNSSVPVVKLKEETLLCSPSRAATCLIFRLSLLSLKLSPSQCHTSHQSCLTPDQTTPTHKDSPLPGFTNKIEFVCSDNYLCYTTRILHTLIPPDKFNSSYPMMISEEWYQSFQLN